MAILNLANGCEWQYDRDVANKMVAPNFFTLRNRLLMLAS